MRSPESKRSGWESVKQLARVGAAGAAVSLAACSAPAETSHNAATVTSSDKHEAAVDPDTEAWHAALHQMREKLATGEEVRLLVPEEPICIFWPTVVEGAVTVQRNPVLYDYRTDEVELGFFPFVSHTKDDMPVLMNGPYQAQDLDANGMPMQSTARGNMGSVTFPTNQSYAVFNEQDLVLSLKKEEPADPFSAAWLEGPDGTRYAETKLVLEEDLANAFPDCKLQSPSPAPPSTMTI